MRFEGKIIPGRGIGRQLGYPTLNFEIPENLNIEPGVIAARLFLNEQELPAVLFFGNRKTFDDQLALEIHVLDDFGAAPTEAGFEILDKIRGVEKFENAEELKKQIQKDCTAARKIFNYEF